jgi:hypothetical protein
MSAEQTPLGIGCACRFHISDIYDLYGQKYVFSNNLAQPPGVLKIDSSSPQCTACCLHAPLLAPSLFVFWQIHAKISCHLKKEAGQTMTG